MSITKMSNKIKKRGKAKILYWNDFKIWQLTRHLKALVIPQAGQGILNNDFDTQGTGKFKQNKNININPM